MRKLKLQMQLSIDSFVAGANDALDWMVWDWDDALKNYVGALTEPVDTIVLGRRLAQGFIPTWAARANNPETTDAAARKFNETAKVVFSQTTDGAEWERTTVTKGALVHVINELKSQPGGDIIAYGGGQFVTGLINNNLIDDYHLFINPVAIGHGMTIFEGLSRQLKLKLVKALPFECGIVVLHYQSAR